MRTKTVRVNDKEFVVRLPGIIIMPYLQLYRKLASTEPESLEDARRRARELSEVVNEILRACVEGPVGDLSFDEQIALLNAVGELLSEAVRPERLQFFREERGG